MLDIGGIELLVIAAVALIVVGPKELPGLVRAVGRWVAKARNLAREFQAGMEAAAEDVDMEEFRKIGSVKSDLEKQVRDIGRSAQSMIDDVEEREPPQTNRRRDGGDRIEPEFDSDSPRPASRYAERAAEGRRAEPRRAEPRRDEGYGEDRYARDEPRRRDPYGERYDPE